ncbi:hypothetical protein [Burkholderia stabilis]|uniref:hypothetical protein n=1 Tax=Burkholderia stabilis TaxID=95485 RepID=UPI000EFB714E|nr:hypothetical protein [Burkholderia stabilis]
MSDELSGMVYDRPMTENQSVIEENEMINCDRKILKYFVDLPLTSDLQGLCDRPLRRTGNAADIHSFIIFRKNNLIECR